MFRRRKPNTCLAPAIKRATLLPLIGIIYCTVAGGPYGLEDIVQLAGYRNAIILLLITPLLWSLPVALMVSELSAALPEEGGYYVWVRRALGPFWGFQEAWLSFADSIFDMAIYPTLFVVYLARIWPAAGNANLGFLIGIALIALCVGLNLLGIRPVGVGSLAMTLALLLPFVAIVVLAMWHGSRPAIATSGAVPQFSLLGGILLAMWNYAGWDNVSTFAGEVHRPQRTYPLAILLCVLLAAVTYVLPIAAASRSGISPQNWDTGTWVDAGRAIGATLGPRAGGMLALAVMAGGMISAFAIFNAMILSYSRLPLALAGDGFLPQIMGRRTRTGVPWVALVACAVGWAVCLKLGFLRLLIIDTILYGLSLLLEFGALVVLRIKEPDLPRPFRVPGGMFGCIVVSIGPLVLMGIACYQAASDPAAISGLVTCGIALVLGVAVYFIAIGLDPQLRRPPEFVSHGFPVILREPPPDDGTADAERDFGEAPADHRE